MANDVQIIVEASLGDTLVKLDLAKRAVQDLGAASGEAAVENDRQTASTGRLSRALGFLTGNWKILVPAITAGGIAILGFTGNIAALAPIIPIVTAALGFLLAPLASLAAIFVALIGPVVLLTGLLGALGAAFFVAAKSAFGADGALGGQVQRLEHQFSNLTKQLVTDFMPVFKFLVSNARDALRYLNDIAKLPLAQAFRSLATTGVQGFSKFLEEIGHKLAMPIRLAFQFAFGGPGQGVSNALGSLFDQVKHFFTSAPPGGKISLAQMFENWFNAHDFTKTGMRWGQELAAAVVGAFVGSLKNLLSSKGGKIIGGSALGGAAIGAVIGGPIGAALGTAIGAAAGIALNHYWPRIEATAKQVWTDVSTFAVSTFHEITTALAHFLGKGTWHNLAVDATLAWDIIKTVAVAAFHAAVTAGKEVWKVFDTLVIKTGAWKIGVWLVRTAIDVIAAVLKPILTIIDVIVHAVTHWSGVVGGALLGAFNAVLGTVNAIIGGITTAVGLAQSLANALSLGSGSLSGAQGRQARGGPAPSSGHVMGAHLAGGNHFHYHAAPGMSGIAERAAFERFARQVGQAQARQQGLLAGGH